MVKTAPQMNNVRFGENDTAFKSEEQQLPEPNCLNANTLKETSQEQSPKEEKLHVKRIRFMLTFRKMH